MKNLWYTLTWKTHFWIWVLNNQFLKKENGKSSYFSVWDDIQYIQNRSNHFRSDSFISTLSLQRWRFDNFFNIEILIRISAIQQKSVYQDKRTKTHVESLTKLGCGVWSYTTQCAAGRIRSGTCNHNVVRSAFPGKEKEGGHPWNREHENNLWARNALK